MRLLCKSFYFSGRMETVVATVGDLCYLCLYHLNYHETSLVIWYITLSCSEMPYNAFVNRADPNQAALLQELPDQGLRVCL